MAVNQTKIQSLKENITNTGSGFIVSLFVWEYVIRPMIGGGMLSVDNSITITMIFTVVSLARGYVWRRVFNKNGN